MNHEWRRIPFDDPPHQSDCLVMDEQGRIFFGISRLFGTTLDFIYSPTQPPPSDFVPRYWFPYPRRPR